MNIPHFETPAGTVLDELWYKDLQLHRLYLDDIHLASPTSRAPAPENSRPLQDAQELGRLSHVPLPELRSTMGAVLAAPQTLWRLWKAVGEADVVHAGVAGWPYPLGWPAALLAKLRRKFLVVNVESAPWRQEFDSGSRLKRLRATLYERLARSCVNAADLPMFTQEGYRDSLLKPGRPGYVDNASWIDADQILPEAAAQAAWQDKPPSPLRLIFAGRVAEAKGVMVLLEAIRRLAERRAEIEVDIIGEGSALTACRQLAAELNGPTTLNILAPKPYGPEFFEVLRPHHAVVVPTLSDEQPRIIYDAYAQAIPALASDTTGNRSCTFDGRTGLLSPAGDVDALVEVVLSLAANPDLAREMGMNALRLARNSTHVAKQLRRGRLLHDLLVNGRPLRECLDHVESPTAEFQAEGRDTLEPSSATSPRS